MKKALLCILFALALTFVFISCSEVPVNEDTLETNDITETKDTDETTAEVDSITESTKDTVFDPDAFTLPLSADEVIQNGSLYTGELNGTYYLVSNDDESKTKITATVYEDSVSAEVTYDEKESLKEIHEGTFVYDTLSRELYIRIICSYSDNKEKTYSSQGVLGKIYEYNGLVHFICLRSDMDSLAVDEMLSFSFEADPQEYDNISVSDWARINEGHRPEIMKQHVFLAMRALLRGDIDGFAKRCGVAPSVYDSLRGMRIGEFELYSQEYYDEFNPDRKMFVPVLKLNVLESNSDFFTVGEHHIAFEFGLQLTFSHLDDFLELMENRSEMSNPTFAQRYVNNLRGDDLSRTESLRKYEFIVSRLNELDGEYKLRSLKEISDYAEKYLNMEVDVEEMSKVLDTYEDGYQIIGRGGGPYLRTYTNEEERDGVTVVTAVFWADYSQTVPAKEVEFHLRLIDGEFSPIKTVVINDYGFNCVYYST